MKNVHVIGLANSKVEELRDQRRRAHFRDIRHADVEALRSYFRPGLRVLEIGGGNGYQASVVAGWGCEVESIDIAEQPPAEPVFHRVTIYDGKSFPYADASFDLVYSCAVLEHVPHLDELLLEVRRVLKPKGRAIHIVPSVAWRFWTMAAHYPHLVRRALTPRAYATGGSSVASSAERPCKLRPAWRRILICGAHGEYPSAAAELYYYSRRRWRGVFEKSGLRVVEVRPNRLFYTGYRLLPSLSATARRGLASFLGSAAYVFIVQRTD